MSRLMRDVIAEPVSRGQILGLERGQRNVDFPCSADRMQDWQPYPVDPYSCYMCDHASLGKMIFRELSSVKKRSRSPPAAPKA